MATMLSRQPVAAAAGRPTCATPLPCALTAAPRPLRTAAVASASQPAPQQWCVQSEQRHRRTRCCATLRQLEDDSQTGTSPGERDAEARNFAVQCAEIVDEAKCQDLLVLHVAPQVSWTSYMVFATVFSKPQLLAAMARLEKMVEEDFPERIRQNQPGASPWECLDYGDVLIHLMTAEQRETYDVEGFYAASEEVDLPFLGPSGQGSGSASGKAPTWAKQA